MIGTILERHTVGKYALGKGAPVRDCRALTPVRNQLSPSRTLPLPYPYAYPHSYPYPYAYP